MILSSSFSKSTCFWVRKIILQGGAPFLHLKHMFYRQQIKTIHREALTFNLNLQVNLVCDDAMMVSHAQLALYFGVLVGSIGFGQLADV